MKINITISDIVNIMTCIGVIIAIIEFNLTRKSTIANYEREKKQSTVDIFREYESDFHRYNLIIYEKFKYNIISYDQIIADEEFLSIIRMYLNKLEFICTGVNIGIYDIDTLDRLFGDVIVRVFHQTYSFIKHLREERQTEIVYAEFEIVSKYMSKLKNERKELLNEKANLKYKI